MKTTTIVLILAFYLAFVSAFPLDHQDGSVVLDSSAPLERRDDRYSAPLERRGGGKKGRGKKALNGKKALHGKKLKAACVAADLLETCSTAELEAARITAELEAARITAVLEAARVAAEEATRLAAEEEVRRVAELKKECLIEKETCSDVELEAWKIECAAVDIAPTCQSVYWTGTVVTDPDMRHPYGGLASDEVPGADYGTTDNR
jgi:hypothetical protein